MPFLPPDHVFEESALLEWAVLSSEDFPYWENPYFYAVENGYDTLPIFMGYVSIKTKTGYEYMIKKAMPYKGLQYIAVYTDPDRGEGNYQYFGMKADEIAVYFNKESFDIIQMYNNLSLECHPSGVEVVFI